MMMQTAPIPAPVQPINDIIKESSRTGTPETITKPQAISETYILSELLDVDRLLITKRLRVKSVVFLRGKKNRFYIRTPDRNLVYTLRVFNNCSEEIMRIDRPYACTARVLPCQLQKIQVFAPPGRRIGSIEQQWTPIRPIYVVKRENGEEVFWLQGFDLTYTIAVLQKSSQRGLTRPRFTISFFRDIQFSIQKRDGTHVGSTCKRLGWRSSETSQWKRRHCF
ncbi:unnamed protein product [Leptidea sinapis]|uniref:Phospholipid scramblase n=1 Tax=Leptidea sinapis TaxID=189913 RepID=A0A5E4R2W8_9NEOP|nr:unnamed protein product [Leptidea sinapis]